MYRLRNLNLFQLREDALLNRQLISLKKYLKISFLQHSVSISLLCYFFHNKELNYWTLLLGVTVISRFITTYLIFNYSNSESNSNILSNPKRIAYLLIFLRAIEGTLLGISLHLVITSSYPQQILIFTFIYTILVIDAILVFSSFFQISIAFTFPLSLISFHHIFLSHDPSFTFLSFFSFIVLIILLNCAWNLEKLYLNKFELQIENLALFEKLRTEEKISQSARNDAEVTTLAAISHDLRQPIHAQSLFIEMLGKTKLDPEQNFILTNIKATNFSSRETLATLLDFSRLDAGMIEPHFQSFNLQPLLNKIDRDYLVQADAKGLVYRTRETPLSVKSDPVLLEMILRNLASNAIHYTSRGGVLIGARERTGFISIEVWDTGVGINSSEIENIFLEYRQLSNPERDSQKGLGLGLAIVKLLANKLNHKIIVNSREKKGSVFKIEIRIG